MEQSFKRLLIEFIVFTRAAARVEQILDLLGEAENLNFDKSTQIDKELIARSSSALLLAFDVKAETVDEALLCQGVAVDLFHRFIPASLERLQDGNLLVLPIMHELVLFTSFVASPSSLEQDCSIKSAHL